MGDWWREDKRRSQSLNGFRYLFLPWAVRKLDHWLLLPTHLEKNQKCGWNGRLGSNNEGGVFILSHQKVQETIGFRLWAVHASAYWIENGHFFVPSISFHPHFWFFSKCRFLGPNISSCVSNLCSVPFLGTSLLSKTDINWYLICVRHCPLFLGFITE